MVKITIKTKDTNLLVDILDWLDVKGWPYKVEPSFNNPFSGIAILLEKSEHEFITKMTWGL